MEDHKSEIDDWEMGAGIYISFYMLRSSLQEDNTTMTELEEKNVKRLTEENAHMKDLLHKEEAQ
ncbi:hypothetical protein ACS0TY_031794 [Phlomoides rotata]